ncbi:MAG: Re/Si-specific NAD(P)(+) transhydrogenase subunit alpha [Coriobacteriia bacterium]|nr:Re/Si-specific NAD(P)(+) transhydrogenase subunit alpha [Coriobacteriia bacterium]MCL2750754.1 Re/Si-specific NAD(P)(+) transhydrogenase subunit alpha [Coriobacteriia bacterium]
MIIGIPLESDPRETRVAATPKSVDQLAKLGYEVLVEAKAGAKAAFPDAEFEQAGARIVGSQEVWGADIVCKINEPLDSEIAAMKKGAYLIGLIGAPRNPELLEKLAKAHIKVLAMDSVPRISRAQSLDVISSMANIGGYRAVIEAANIFGSFFTGQVTAAGKVPPAKVFVSGAGVAGLAAIGTANSLGAIVRATDIRAEVAEEVKSMGAEFVAVEAESQTSEDGYAKEATEDYAAAAARMYAEQAKEMDIIITTALIPGRPAPRLLTAEMVASMKPGSVIVDMAAGTGGNVEGSRPDEVVTTANGVKIIGYTDLPCRLPTQASQLYSQNVVNLMKLLTPEKDGALVLDIDDPVQRGMLVAMDGEVMWPPPVVAVSAAPKQEEAPVAAQPMPEKKPRDKRITYAVLAFCALAFLALFTISPSGLIGHFMVLMLSIVIGFYVIGNVSHKLHTPLMSVTNAISGIILVGCLLGLVLVDQNTALFAGTNLAILMLSVCGILLASINVFGGFTVTQRMLKMFRKG